MTLCRARPAGAERQGARQRATTLRRPGRRSGDARRAPPPFALARRPGAPACIAASALAQRRPRSGVDVPSSSAQPQPNRQPGRRTSADPPASARRLSRTASTEQGQPELAAPGAHRKGRRGVDETRRRRAAAVSDTSAAALPRAPATADQRDHRRALVAVPVVDLLAGNRRVRCRPASRTLSGRALRAAISAAGATSRSHAPVRRKASETGRCGPSGTGDVALAPRCAPLRRR